VLTHYEPQYYFGTFPEFITEQICPYGVHTASFWLHNNLAAYTSVKRSLQDRLLIQDQIVACYMLFKVATRKRCG